MPESYHVLVVAAGRGSRAGAGMPKQFRALAGQPVLTRTLQAFLQRPDIASVVPVIHADDTALFAEACGTLDPCLRDKLARPVIGGATRQASVHAGLETLAERHGGGANYVLIHDGARPFASPALIGRAMEGARRHGAAVPGCAMFDTVKQVGDGGVIVGTPDRTRLRAVQTPQAFGLDLIVAAHRRAVADGRHDLTDDAAVAEFAGHDVFVFEGDPLNSKITTSDDLQAAETRLLSTLPDVRTGQGFDVHSFMEGDHVWLGGVKIPHSQALTGHSDADVVLHALTDALLGAIGDGDIGTHFPPSEMRWKGASSDIFLRHAMDCVRRLGGVVAHLNATLVCEAPKVGPHREAMRARIAEIAGLTIDRVAITATTSERLGFTGRREGIAACRARRIMLATAESCTGGLVSALLTEIAGSSAVFERGFVTYSNAAKQALLGVPAEILDRHGAVSPETARAMALGALSRSDATIAASVTGIAGPGGGSAEKPVGLVHFGLAVRGGPARTIERRFGDRGRAAVRTASLEEALRLFEEAVAAYPAGAG